jgi:hypothetical protein
MSCNANEHDRSGRCVRHPEVKLRRRKVFLPGTKYVLKWSKRLRYCPCCAMEFVLAVDPEVKGQVSLTRKGRLELILPHTNSTTDDVEYASSSAASPSSYPSGSRILSKESDASYLAAGSNVSQKAGTCGELDAITVKLDNTPFHYRRNLRDNQVVDKVDSEFIGTINGRCNSHENNAYQQQPPLQLNSSPTNVRALQKHLNPDPHQTDAIKPPVDDVIVSKDLMGSVSWDGASDIDDIFSLNQLGTTQTHLDSEIVKDGAWLCLIDSWRREKDEMIAAMNALKNENKQLRSSMDYMKKWLKKSSNHETQNNNGVTYESLTDSQEFDKEMIHQHIQSQQDDINCVSIKHQKEMEEVVTLLQQQVNALEVEKEVNKAMHENEIEILQQEIKSLQQSHSVTMCKLVKMALEREKENGKTLLGRFEKIEQERRSYVSEIGKKFRDVSHLETKPKEKMTNGEVLELKYKYSVQKSELNELRAKLAKQERRKEKGGRKKKKSKEKKKDGRNGKNDRSDEEDMSLSIDEVGDVAFVHLELDDDSFITVSSAGVGVYQNNDQEPDEPADDNDALNKN